jgi:hypothetical protein
VHGVVRTLGALSSVFTDDPHRSRTRRTNVNRRVQKATWDYQHFAVTHTLTLQGVFAVIIYGFAFNDESGLVV